ncbi:JLP2 DnaJ-Like Protein 2 [Apiospora phragmitis]|uniref:JLP2 DnaJ-Like Protein 2 n=1 Tax=Apiospora phragmitis TaxID=2905665 RepID=A0ABR1WT70_9PEZI
MVYYFTSAAVTPAAYVYVGKDKFENEELIKHGWEEDVWYVPRRQALLGPHLPAPARGRDLGRDPGAPGGGPGAADQGELDRGQQEGQRDGHLHALVEPKKDGSMAVGQVSFKDPRKVRRVLVPERENAVVNRLNKTKVERHPDLRQEKEDRQKELRKRDNSAQQARKKEEARIMKERAEKKWQKEHAYDEIFSEENMAQSSNQDRDEDWEDDFM